MSKGCRHQQVVRIRQLMSEVGRHACQTRRGTRGLWIQMHMKSGAEDVGIPLPRVHTVPENQQWAGVVGTPPVPVPHGQGARTCLKRWDKRLYMSGHKASRAADSPRVGDCDSWGPSTRRDLPPARTITTLVDPAGVFSFSRTPSHSHGGRACSWHNGHSTHLPMWCAWFGFTLRTAQCWPGRGGGGSACCAHQPQSGGRPSSGGVKHVSGN